jgi:hypothetical protein
VAVSLNVKEFKASFFDTAGLTDKVEAAKLKALSAIGAYTRKVARNSMKRRKDASPPGTPPNAHVGLFKSLMFFAYDATAKSVVIGPALFTGGRLSGSAVPAPAVEEFGGQQALVKKVFQKVTGRKATKSQADAFLRKVKDGSIVRKKATFVLEKKAARYPARPFMAPALDTSKVKFSSFFLNSI